MIELKPCPFCGEKATMHDEYEVVKRCAFVRCSKCGASTRSVVEDIDYCAKEKVAELWNTRAESEE